MMRSLYSGISGLRNHQTRMDVIGNNVSNVNTTGFKASRTIFQDIFSQTLSGGMANTGAIGGTNPIQVGLGIRLSTVDVMHTGAPFGRTDNPFDMMIENEGFFIVQSPEGNLFTRVGNFGLDNEGFLVTSEGMFVLGFGPDMTNVERAPRTDPGSIVFIPATEAVPGFTGTLLDGFVISPAAVRTLATPDGTGWLNGIADREGEVADGFTLDPNEVVRLVQSWPLVAAQWTVQPEVLPTYTLDPDLVGSGDPALIAANLETGVGIANFLAMQPAAGWTNDPDEVVQLATVGNAAAWDVTPVTGTLLPGFVRDPALVRQLAGYPNPGDGWLGGLPTIAPIAARPATVEFPPQEYWDMENLQPIRLRVPDPENPEEFADLLGFSVAPNGTISVVIDNVSRDIAQVALALFANTNGLERAGNSLWRQTASSGEAVVTRPMEEGAGTINGGGLEMSNVDLASEFTDMIVTQRGYQANSRIITVSDSLLEELVNLKR